MTADLRTAAQKALVALEYHTQQTRPIEQTEHAIKTLMEALAAAPVVKDSLTTQAPAEDVVVTWNHDRSRILAVTRQDDDGRILSVIAEVSVPKVQPNVQPKGNDKADEWRKLAQQFDGQRMAAMVHLRTLLAFPQAHAEAARAFLAATPAEQIASVQAPAPGAVELPAGLSHSDAEFWLRKRGEIIDALRAEGLTMVTTLKGVQFMRLGKIEAQTAAQAPAVQAGKEQAE